MGRHRLSLSKNIKGQSTISSFFTKKASTETKTVNGEISEATCCSPSTAATIVTDNKANPSAKRSAEVVNLTSPVQLSKKAKTAESNTKPTDQSSPDIIPATPEDQSKKLIRHHKSKSKRKIGFLQLPTAEENPSKRGSEKILNEDTLKKRCSEESKEELKKKSETISSVIKLGDNLSDKSKTYSTAEDPLLAEILGDISLIDSSLPANNGSDSKQLKVSKKNLFTTSTSQKPKVPTSNKNVERKCSNGLACVSKETEVMEKVLKDSTASKSSPNKDESASVAKSNSEEKARNIFFDGADEDLVASPGRQFFIKRISHKKSLDPTGSSLQENKPAIKIQENESVQNTPEKESEVPVANKLQDNKPAIKIQENKSVQNTPEKESEVPVANKLQDNKPAIKIQEKDSVQNMPEKESEIPVGNGTGSSKLPEKQVSVEKPSVEETNYSPGKEAKLLDSLEEFDMECFNDDWTLSQFHTNKMPNAPVSYEESLDLAKAVHCKVLSVEEVKPYVESKMWVECIKSKRTASCSIRGTWVSLSLKADDIVCVEAVLADKSCGTRWLVDGTSGMLVNHPNTLISGTAVVGSLFCERRSVLSDSFRGFDGSNDVMAIGTLVHEILQEVLKKNVRTLEDIRRAAQSMLSDPKTVRLCYDADMSMAHVQKELSHFLPSIENFLSKYVTIQEPRRKGHMLGAPLPPKGKVSSAKMDPQEWSGNIIGVEDIEENLWDPMLGLKGKIDVTVKVREKGGEQKVLPLELKTGRASHSAEHRGQVMLYAMMMSRLGLPVQSGLLLYLRESSIREVKVSPSERRDLLMLRNRLAHHLESQARVDVDDIENLASLPEPINFGKACAKCPYLTICSVHVNREKGLELADSHPLKSLGAEATAHLSPAHIDYFFHWSQMIRLESQEQKKGANSRHIWSLAPEKREKLGQALVNLRIDGDVAEDAGKFVHSFVRSHDLSLGGTQPLCDDFRKCCLSAGDYVIVSTDARIAVDTGFVQEIATSSICLALNRDLRKRNPNDTFHLDTYGSNYASAANLTNLSCLLDDTETAKRVREAIIDRVPPRFDGEIKMDVMAELTPILAELNDAQREAATAVLKSDRYALIKGLPGTGKTATMVALVGLVVKLGQSVLISSQTHSAVDNLLLRLKQKGINFLRLGSAARIHPELEENSEGFVTRNCRTPEDLQVTLETYQVVGVTCLGMNHPMFFRGRVFDICLVDESTQVLQSTAIRPLLNAKRFVLVGDPDQLPPVVTSRRAQQLGLGESLFARLDSGSATKSLIQNYRMNQAITDLANSLTYKGLLKCGLPQVANAVLDSPRLREVREALGPPCWLRRVLSPSPPASVLFLDSRGARVETPPDWEETSVSEVTGKVDAALVNFYEVGVITTILETLVKAGIEQNDVGVIAPYRAQVTLIRKVLEPREELKRIEVNSVDQYQGRDKEVILYSCTRSDASARVPKDNEILNDHRRLTVAISRAKRKLVVIGDQSTLNKYAPFAKLFSCLAPEQIVPMPNQIEQDLKL